MIERKRERHTHKVNKLHLINRSWLTHVTLGAAPAPATLLLGTHPSDRVTLAILTEQSTVRATVSPIGTLGTRYQQS